jgi:hypothetical protein
MLLRTTHFLPRELAERQFLLKSSRAPARVGALKQTLRVCHLTQIPKQRVIFAG